MPATQSVRKPSRVHLRRGYPLTQGLRAAYPFFAGAGRTAWDISGRNAHAEITNAVWDVGFFGSELSFDGSTDYCRIPADPALDITGELSIITWLNPTSLTDLTPVFTRRGDSIGNTTATRQYQFRLGENNGDALELSIYNGSFATTTGSAGVVTTGEYQQAAVTFDESTASFYHNGTLDTANTFNESLSSFDVDNWIGIEPDTQNLSEYDGDIGQVLVYDRIVTPTEMAALYADPFIPFITKPR